MGDLQEHKGFRFKTQNLYKSPNHSNNIKRWRLDLITYIIFLPAGYGL